MKRIIIIVEGETEERFVKDVLMPYFIPLEIFLSPRMITTNREMGRKGKGGFERKFGYHKHIKREILESLRDQEAFSTTMMDLYGLPNDFPGINNSFQTSDHKLESLEDEFQKDINHPRFISHLVKHEFEGLLFSDVKKILQSIAGTNAKEGELKTIRRTFATPEDINDNVNTAPSKRLIKIFPDYQKALHGPIIARNIGLQVLRQECPHFNSWIEKLERLHE